MINCGLHWVVWLYHNSVQLSENRFCLAALSESKILRFPKESFNYQPFHNVVQFVYSIENVFDSTHNLKMWLFMSLNHSEMKRWNWIYTHFISWIWTKTRFLVYLSCERQALLKYVQNWYENINVHVIFSQCCCSYCILPEALK